MDNDNYKNTKTNMPQYKKRLNKKENISYLKARWH